MPTTELAPPHATTVGAVHLPLVATLTAPLHHGSGTAGNTALLRTQDIVLPDGRAASVPFVSGNSVRHTLRAALAWHLVGTLGIEEGSLSKPVVDLLWSGGAITKTGAETRLDRARRVEELLPFLSLLGFSAGSDMVAGTLSVNHLHLVCAENTWRLPAVLESSPHAAKGAGAYRGEEFGTRHDIVGTPVQRYLADVGDVVGSTTQMIYDMQVLKAGAVLAGSLDLTPAATAAQRAVLLVALDEAAPSRGGGARTIRLAAKAAVGYGQAALVVDLSPLGDVTAARTWWETHLVGHREEILELLAEVVA
jgi:hypothetical protein